MGAHLFGGYFQITRIIITPPHIDTLPTEYIFWNQFIPPMLKGKSMMKLSFSVGKGKGAMFSWVFVSPKSQVPGWLASNRTTQPLQLVGHFILIFYSLISKFQVAIMHTHGFRVEMQPRWKSEEFACMEIAQLARMPINLGQNGTKNVEKKRSSIWISLRSPNDRWDYFFTVKHVYYKIIGYSIYFSLIDK